MPRRKPDEPPRRLNCTLPLSLMEQLQAEADRQERSPNQQINYILREWFKQHPPARP